MALGGAWASRNLTLPTLYNAFAVPVWIQELMLLPRVVNVIIACRLRSIAGAAVNHERGDMDEERFSLCDSSADLLNSLATEELALVCASVNLHVSRPYLFPFSVKFDLPLAGIVIVVGSAKNSLNSVKASVETTRQTSPVLPP